MRQRLAEPVQATRTAEEALDRAALRTPDAVIVEMLLPDGNGVDLCRQLAAWGSPALTVLSVVDDEEQKVLALEAGADDYVLKPFAPRELIARLHAILRRASLGSDRPILEFRGMHIDLAGARRPRPGKGGPPHTDRMQTSRSLAGESRTAHHARCTPAAGLGHGACGGSSDATRPRGKPTPKTWVTRRTIAHPHLPRRWVPVRRLEQR